MLLAYKGEADLKQSKARVNVKGYKTTQDNTFQHLQMSRSGDREEEQNGKENRNH